MNGLVAQKFDSITMNDFMGMQNYDKYIIETERDKSMKHHIIDGMEAKDFFRRIDFAVLSRSADQYNYKEFARNFSDFYREEDAEDVADALERVKETEVNLDRIRGSLVGGAIGDALGYAVEIRLPQSHWL